MTTKTHDAPGLAVISASPRRQRMGEAVSAWVLGHLDTGADLIDLAEISLPDDAGLGAGGSTTTEVGHRLDSADAFVIVTPEYNRSFPGALKRLIDWHYSEWELKPAVIVGYGVTGGHDAIAQLRPVLAELNMVVTRRDLGLPAPWNHTDEDGFTPSGNTDQALKAALEELSWWAEVLADARRDRPFPG